ncbi:hypothetical protein FRB95_000282 [Tulasnella sp. JGI-2019a]|nr:hypothetical protein FRB95_000282 [Tulasnella sp. JGI-2019a]
MSYSLYDTLTNHGIADPVPASIDLINFLLKAVGQDACEVTRNTQSLYRFVSRARDVTTKINGLITNVEGAADDIGGFNDFETYTGMIGPLEDELFRVFSVFPGETEDLLTRIQTTPPKTVDDLHKPYNTWINNRKEIRDAYNNLHDGEIIKGAPGTPDDVAAVAKYDDLSWLTQLADNISTYEIKGSPSNDLLNAVKAVADKFAEILGALRAQASVPEESMVLAIRAAMVSFTAICMIDPTKTTTPEDKELQKRLQLPKETWGQEPERALSALEKILTGITGNTALDDQSEASKEWAAFEVYLLGDAWASLLPIVIQLLKYVGKIKRHYYAQSVTLVKLCIGLEKGTRKKGADTAKPNEGLTTRDVQKIEDALDAAKAALIKATEEADTRLLANQDYNDSRTNGAGPVFDAAVTKIKDAYSGHSLTYDAALMTTAQETDRDVLKKLEDHWNRLKDRSKAPAPINMKVALTLCDGPVSASGGTPQSVELLDSEIVDAIIWKIKPSADLKTHSPRFYKQDAASTGFVEVPAGTKLKSIPNVPLFLAVTNLPAFIA